MDDSATSLRSHYAVFEKREQAEAASRALCDAGFDAADISLISPHGGSGPHDRHQENLNDSGAIGAAAGATIAGAGGLLAGLGLVAIPGIGPLMMGPVAAAVCGAVTGGALGGMAGSLTGLGFSASGAALCESHHRAGKTLLLIGCHMDERARSIMHDAGALEFSSAS